MPGLIILAIVAGFAALLLLAWRFGRPATTLGAAAWLRLWDAFAEGLFERKGLLVGDWAGLLPVFYQDTHAITFGPAGSGKGVRAILPNLLCQRFVFLNDPGGENTAVAIAHFRTLGRVYVINPFDMHCGAPWRLPVHGFNPLAILDPQSPSFVADALLIAEMLIPRTGKEAGASLYFKNAAQTLLQAMIMHIVTRAAARDRHLGRLYEYLHLDAARWEKLLRAMRSNPAGSGLIARKVNALERREVQAPEEFSAILSTAQEDLAWLADPLVRENFARNDVDFAALKGAGPARSGAAIAVVMPLEYNESHAAIPRLALACALWEMQRGDLAREKVVFVIDEASALGKVTRFPNWLATLRKYRAVLWPIFQNIGQVSELYGAQWQTFISNCGLRQFLGAADPETAEYVHKLLGERTAYSESINPKGQRSRSQARRALLTPEEILHLDPRKQVVLIGAHKPLLLTRTAYWDRPELQGRFVENPYHAGLPRMSAATSLRVLLGRLVYGLAFGLTPHPAAGAVWLALLGVFVLFFAVEGL